MTSFPASFSQRAFRLLGWGYGQIPSGLSVIAASGIVFMMLLICTDVGMRFLFNAPIAGVNEIVSMLIVSCVFLQLGSTIGDGRMIRADFIMQHWRRGRPALAHFAEVGFFSVAALLLFFALRWLWDDFAHAYQTNEFVGAVGAYQIRTWPFKFGVVLGCGIALLECVRVATNTAFLLRWYPSVNNRDWLAILAFMAIVLITLAAAFTYLTMPLHIGAVMIVLLLASVAIGMPIAFALLALSFLGVWLIRQDIDIAIFALGTTFSSAISSYEFAVVPLFVIMGLLLDKADVARDAFHVCSALLRKLPGALGIATVAGNAIFASVTGTSIASASVFSRIAVPPMIENGYTKRFSVGVVAGSSVLGMLIPPSILLIIYGLIAETSIGRLFIAGILPGVLLACAFAVLNIGLATFFPRFVGTPREPQTGEITVSTVVVKLSPIVGVVGVVMGGIYAGIFTPTEAGGVGALVAFVVAALRRKVTLKTIKEVALETAYISAAILFLIITASYYGRMLTLSRIPFEMTSAIGQLDVNMWQFLLLYLVTAVLLGTILDAVSVLLIMVPLVLPVVTALGGDLVWFGIVTILAIEIGLLTPPFGLAVFVIKGSFPPGFVSLTDIFIGAAPFVGVMVFVTLLVMAFPQISLLLL